MPLEPSFFFNVSFFFPINSPKCIPGLLCDAKPTWGKQSPPREPFQSRSPHPNSNTDAEMAAPEGVQPVPSPSPAGSKGTKTPADTNTPNYKVFKGSLIGLELIAVNKITRFDQKSKQTSRSSDDM